MDITVALRKGEVVNLVKKLKVSYQLRGGRNLAFGMEGFCLDGLTFKTLSESGRLHRYVVYDDILPFITDVQQNYFKAYGGR